MHFRKDWLTLAGLNVPFMQPYQLIKIWVWRKETKATKNLLHTQIFYHPAPAIPQKSHFVYACMYCMYLFACRGSRGFNAKPWDKHGAFCGMHRLLWACSEMWRWPGAQLLTTLCKKIQVRPAPFTPPGHIWHSTVCHKHTLLHWKCHRIRILIIFICLFLHISD